METKKRVLRPRRNSGAAVENSERRSFSDRPRRNYGDSEGRNFGERRSYGDRPSRQFGSNDERRPSRSFGNNDERRPARPFNGERNSYGDNRPRRSFGDSGERRPARPFNGERSSYGSDRPRRSYGDNEGRTFGERKNYGPKRSFGDNGRFGGRNAKGGFKKPAKRQFDESGIDRMIERKPIIDPAFLSDSDTFKVPVKDVIRLNKFIANSGVCSRREADSMIEAGVVTVNGEVVTELGTKINIYTDDVRFNGEKLKGEEKVYIVMNKPKGYVTTASDPHADKTVMDLLKGLKSRVFPVGRLDKNTTGVLMFTNDGEIAEKLTHPSYDKRKIYQVNLDSSLRQEDFDQILSGIALNDGEIAADELEYIDEKDRRKVGIEIHSGKNRIVRRIFETLGYEVKALDRVYFAGLTKKGIKRGGWRYLSEGEVNILKMGAYR